MATWVILGDWRATAKSSPRPWSRLAWTGSAMADPGNAGGSKSSWLTRHVKNVPWAQERRFGLSVDPVFAFGGITEGEFSAARRDLRIALADCLRCDFLPECHMASTEIRDLRRTLPIRGLLVKQMVCKKHAYQGSCWRRE